MEQFFCEQLTTKIVGSYDVFVLGGGIAGISSALAAARQNKKVLLCEKSYILGGLATSGLVTIYLPLCDGYGRQVSFGIAEELLKLSVKDWHEEKRGYNTWIAKDKKEVKTEKEPRYEVEFNPSLFALSCERLLKENGVNLLYGTSVVSCVKKGKRIDAVITENKSGRAAYQAHTFIDASGDCDLAYFSQTPTLEFQQKNVLAAWYYDLQNGENHLNMLGFCDIPEEEKNGKEGTPLLYEKRYLGLSGEELSEMNEMSHKIMYSHILKDLSSDPKDIPLLIPSIPQVRMTRHIIGDYTLTKENAEYRYDNSIGLVSNWKKRGPIYEIPFDILYNHETVNLICAGRCVSNDEYMWDILRVIPCCAVTGEAAGTAAAISDDFPSTDIQKLQEILSKNGVILHR